MLVAFIRVLRVQDSAVKNGLYLASGVFVVGRSMVQQQFARPKPVWVHIFRIEESDVVGGTRGTSTINGMTDALRPSANFLAKPTENSRCTSQLENHPPARHPIPAAAYGIQANAPTDFTSKLRASYKYFGNQNK